MLRFILTRLVSSAGCCGIDHKRVIKGGLKVKSKNSWVGSILTLVLAGVSSSISQEGTPLKSIRIGMPIGESPTSV